MIYLDHNATTPLDDRVREAMLPYLGPFYGNPSSLHRLGRLSRGAVDTAREQVAALAGAHPSQVVFTSGGTEANNLALKGLAAFLPAGTILAGTTEHPAVQAPLEFLRRHGWAVKAIKSNPLGEIDLATVDDAGLVDIRFATHMLANNETGIIHDLSALAGWLRDRGAVLHCDAVQAAGKLALNFNALGVHLMSLSSHKIYGPKGAGALIVDPAIQLEPLLHGGGQERDLRGGTENVPAIVGFGKAAELALAELGQRREHLLRLRLELEMGLKNMQGTTIFAEAAERLSNTVQFGVSGIDGETLVMALDRKGFAVSSGSACASGAGEPSPVLLALGIPPDVAKSAIRVSLGKDNQASEIPRFLDSLKAITTEFALSPALH